MDFICFRNSTNDNIWLYDYNVESQNLRILSALLSRTYVSYSDVLVFVAVLYLRHISYK